MLIYFFAVGKMWSWSFHICFDFTSEALTYFDRTVFYNISFIKHKDSNFGTIMEFYV